MKAIALIFALLFVVSNRANAESMDDILLQELSQESMSVTLKAAEQDSASAVAEMMDRKYRKNARKPASHNDGMMVALKPAR